MKRPAVVAAAVVATGIAVLCLPPVQRALFLGIAHHPPQVELGLERVVAGPWGAKLTGLRLTTSHLELATRRVDVDLAFWSSLLGRQLDIEELRATGVELRITRATAAAELADERSEPAPFRGVAQLVRLPEWLVVRRIAADGVLNADLGNQNSVAGRWAAELADLRPGREGRGTIDATVEARHAAEVVLEADVEGALNLETHPDGAVHSFDAILQLQGTDGGTPQRIDATVTAELEQQSESYSLVLAAPGAGPVLELGAEMTAETRVLEAHWSASAPPGLIQSFAPEHTFPELSGTSSGAALLDLDTGRVEVEVVAGLQLSELARIDERMAETGSFTAKVEAAIAHQGSRFECRNLVLTLVSADKHEMLRLATRIPLAVDLEAETVVPERWGDPVLHLEVDRFPMRWTRGFDPSDVVEAGTISGAFDVILVDETHARLLSAEPIRTHGLRLRAGEGSRPPAALDLLIVPRLEFGGGELHAVIERARLEAETGLEIDFEGELSTERDRWPVLSLSGDLAMRIPKLTGFIDTLDLVSGSASFDLDLERMTVAVGDAQVEAATPDGRSLCSVELAGERPVELGLPSLRPNWDRSGPQLLRARFDGLPVAWLSPYIPELDIATGQLFGDLEATGGSGRGLSLASAAPFEIRDLRFSYRDRPWSSTTDLSLEPRLRLDDAGIVVSLGHIVAGSAEGGRLDGEITLEAHAKEPGHIRTRLWLEGYSPSVADRVGHLGALRIVQQGSLDVARRRLEIAELELGLADRSGTRFLELASLRPFELSMEPFGVRVAGESSDILIATITPLELERLFPRILGLKPKGVLPQGQFVGRAVNGALVLAAEEPLEFRDVSVSWNDAPLLDRVTIGLTYEVLYSTTGLHARSIAFTTFDPDGTPLADATLQAFMPLTDRSTLESLHFAVQAQLEPLARQPIFSGLPSFAGGTFDGAVDVAFGEHSTLTGAVELRGVNVQNRGVLPDLELAFDVDAVPGHRLRVHAPLRLSSASGSSDLAFTGSAGRTGDDYSFDASLIGDRLSLPDLRQLLDLVRNLPNDRSPATSTHLELTKEDLRARVTALGQLRERRSTAPFWSEHVTGRARLEIGVLELASGSVDSIRGRLDVDPRKIELSAASASILDAPLTADGALRFDPDAPAPYRMEFEASVHSLDVARILRAVAPDDPPTLEGLYAMELSLTGIGRNPLDLGLNTLGVMRLHGQNGVFRGLAGRYRRAGRRANLAGFLSFSKELKAVGRLIDTLEELEFDSFDLVLEHTDPGRFEVTELTVLSPLVRLEGGGGILPSSDLPFALSPVDIRMELATRDDMTVLFDGMGLLEPAADAQGYRPLNRAVTIAGTVAEPDTSDFFDLLDAGAKNAGGSFGLGLRSINRKLRKGRAAKTGGH